MKRSHFSPTVYQSITTAHKPMRSAKGIREFLQDNNGIAALLPAAERLAALQKDCAVALPAMFDACALIQFTSSQLTLSAPNAAIAAKLKQHIPRMQEFLTSRGWQVIAVRIKVQVNRPAASQAPPPRSLSLPASAIAAFSELEASLAQERQDTALMSAVQKMLARRR